MPKEKITALITARGGSKRIPGKNLKLLNGKPLIWYPIRDARASRHINDFYMSTEDSKIAAVARNYGAKVIDRPRILATDDATSDSVFKHAIEELRLTGLIVVLQPTSPLRTAKDVDACIDIFLRHRPSILITMGPRGTYTGSVYIFDIREFRKARFKWQNLLNDNPYIYMMSARHEVTNINYFEDWKMAEKLLFVKDDKFKPYSFQNHLAKEKENADKISQLYPYIYGADNLIDLKKKNNDLYLKLRDNPQRIKTIINIPCGLTALDIGCSDGLVTLAIAKKNKNAFVTGIDIRPEAVSESLSLLKKWPSPPIKERISFAVSTIEDLLKKKRKYDTVFFTEVLEHIDHREHHKILKDVTLLLGKGGNLVISVPNRYPADRYVKEGRQRWNAPAHRSYFGRSNFEALLRQHFNKIDYYTLPADKKPEEGLWLIANCYQHENQNHSRNSLQP